MRIGALGDIHCEHVSLEAVLRSLQREGVERIVSVGDLCDGPGDLKRTVALLRDAHVDTVAGNHERWLLSGQLRDLPDATRLASLDAETRTWLAALPRTRELDTPRGRLLVCHGLGEEDMEQVRPHDTGYALDVKDALWALVRAQRWRYVVNGHSHQRMVRPFGELTVINVGTLSRQHDPCFAVIDFSRGEVRYNKVDGDRVEEVLDVVRLPG